MACEPNDPLVISMLTLKAGPAGRIRAAMLRRTDRHLGSIEIRCGA
jgi:hypothetical protein